MTRSIHTALQAARQLIQAASDSASLDAQVLLADVLGVDRSYLLSHPEQTLTAEQDSRFTSLVERCAAGEPLAYLIGRRAFYDRDLIVSPDVLVPRPETELSLERALTFAKGRASLTAVDVGTGSGTLAVTFAANCPQATVYATDLSPAAIAIARQNAALHQAKVTFFEGDLLQPLLDRDTHVDLIMANLPYIPSEEVPALAVSKYEPLMALDGGADGLVLVRRLLSQAVTLINHNGLIVLEIGAGQGAAAQMLAQEAFPTAHVSIELDYAGLDRMVVIDHK
ncbi:MAG: peptide chain release factor N(5)-glutamine methyltransferase [Anaerolineaceae bacterium]|nr:peptide chain release factor N(5)-glutamine methyltransferase [Anaerolineaceae bacterium]